MHRVPTSFAKKTYSRRGLAAQPTWKKSMASVVEA
jgi:hypothetical protein